MTDTPPAYEAAVAREVEKAMTATGHTVLSLAEATTIPRITLQRHFKGLTPFNARELQLVAAVLGVSPSQFLLDAESAA
jgi:hypothetical protein